jgi:hypothetical protein
MLLGIELPQGPMAVCALNFELPLWSTQCGPLVAGDVNSFGVTQTPQNQL